MYRYDNRLVKCDRKQLILYHVYKCTGLPTQVKMERVTLPASVLEIFTLFSIDICLKVLNQTHVKTYICLFVV